MGIKQIDLKHCIKETYFDYFYKQCESNPLKKCLISISTNDFLSYKQTNDLSNKIAHFLLSSLKVKQNSVIGILMERSAKIPLAMIGINKAKCGFLIIDKKTPIKRMEFMLENSNVKNVITDSFTKDELKIKSINIIPFDKILNFSKNYPLPKILPNDILCHSYTSGTTGMPKCIIQKHVALKNVADAYANRLVPANIVENTIYGVFPPISFVVFLTDILCSIALGFEVHILSLSEQSSYVNLITYINDNKLTHCFVPPSLLNVFIERYNGDSLKLVLTGGDTVFINAKPKFDILVGYGLSEALSVMLYKFITPDSHITSVSYDGIIDGNLLYLVNEKNQVINQIGEIGEICISGPKVSVGYQNLPNENKKVFVNNPWNKNEIHYYEKLLRTGDYAKYTSSNAIEILGRKDSQVEINGNRVELKEVEKNLRNIPGITESYILKKTDHDGENYLIGYFSANGTLSINFIKEKLSEILMPYMIPRFFKQVDFLPRNTNGKVDISQLPPIDLTTYTSISESENNSNKLEIITDMFKKILRLNMTKIDINANFFDLGGSSIKAMELAYQIEQKLHFKILASDIFNNPTIKKLHSFIQKDGKNELVRVIGKNNLKSVPLFFFHTANNGTEVYNPLIKLLNSNISVHCFENYNLLINQHKRLNGIKKIASFYVKHLKTIQSKGPYFLGGWSYGGTIAFEVALQLQKNGEKVEKLFILDSNIVNSAKEREVLEKLKESNYFQRYLMYDPFCENIRKSGLLDKLLKNGKDTMTDLIEYKPTSVYQGDFYLFKENHLAGINNEKLEKLAGDSKINLSEFKKINGFDKFINPNKIKIIHLSETHDLMLTGKSLYTIAQTINRSLSFKKLKN